MTGLQIALAISGTIGGMALLCILWFTIEHVVDIAVRKNIKRQWEEWKEENPFEAAAIKEYNIDIKL